MSTCRIAVTGFVRHYDGTSRTGVNAAYVARVAEAGALPLVLSPLVGERLAAEALEGCGGLLLSGGEDVVPSRYHATPSSALGPTDAGRDAFELSLLAAARARGIPVLAICRGMQLANVACGGTLWQDLPSERPGGVAHRQSAPITTGTHAVRVERGTRLASLLGTEHLRTNSTHHQAVRELGRGLRATGWTEDGLVESLEASDAGEWLVAVQWHPEELAAGAPDVGLFRGFAAAARGPGR